jgi:hypothetical protein
MPRIWGPPILIDIGVSAGQLRSALDPSAREFDEFALALAIEVPVTRYAQIDLAQRLNLLDGHRTSAGLTINLGNRAFVRGTATIVADDTSRPLGIYGEGGFRF